MTNNWSDKHLYWRLQRPFSTKTSVKKAMKACAPLIEPRVGGTSLSSSLQPNLTPFRFYLCPSGPQSRKMLEAKPTSLLVGIEPSWLLPSGNQSRPRGQPSHLPDSRDLPMKRNQRGNGADGSSRPQLELQILSPATITTNPSPTTQTPK
jgi:hypothetical protein